ncbi:MAG TPA: LCP family protein [Intrasporangium sp.]|uniref:LCP family protein n=1 Tax=Intrasporangium sp. TaxID=1925024 RepID=UPI002D771D7F|nr:LCP family protein [Intrasporangium sp.]HET7399930.1 LCP family protein [Intrasporangium sp.]
MTPPDRPAQPRRPGDGGRDDDAYVVDTRRRGRRPDPGPPRERPARAADAGGSARRGTPASPRSETEGAYVVDTRHRAGSRAATPAPASRAGLPPQAVRASAASAPRRRRRRGRLVALVVALLLLAWLAFLVWVPVNAWNHVERVAAAPAGDRPTGGQGSNFLLVGSDSRSGLTEEQKKRFGATDAEGKRTDSIILVHVPAGSGKAVMVSLPRDSYVPIPGYGRNKINAAYPLGGPRLLVETVEAVSGLRVDGYLEIGFGGFASIVDALGGVDICVPFRMKDPEAGIDLQKGCQTLNGADALGFVRTRHTDPRGDLGRADRQRQFLSAVMKKALTPSTVLIPWRYKAAADAIAGGLVLGEDTSMWEAVSALRAMRSVSNGDGISATVPIADANYATAAGSSVKWDSDKAVELFRMLKEDEPLTVVPKGAGN